MGLFKNRVFSSILSEGRHSEKIVYNQDGYYIHSSSKEKKYKLTVVMPVYNADATIDKAIDSVMNQTIGFNNIEFIIIDDHSTDNTKQIITQYAKSSGNIVSIFLKENTGSPAIPRNLGIHFAKGEYLTFIDADDWLANNGLEVLYNILEKNKDDYAIGKTIKIYDKKKVIAGEYNSWADRDSISPYSIPHVFQHLGPTARMMRTKFIKGHNFQFPNMKYAEDKQFFIDVLTNCPTISTSKEIIYYANRLKENKSLVTTTSIFEKTDTNISVINYVIKKQLPEHIEKMILNRLYEFDCITRLFNREHFLKSKEKQKYFNKLAEILNTTKELRYDFTDNFFEPWHKVLVDLFKEERYDDIVTLIHWSLKDNIKETFIENGLPYYRLPFDDKYQAARINMLAYHKSSTNKRDGLLLRIKIYGDYLNEINSFVIRQRDNDLNQIELPIKPLSNNEYEVNIPYERIADLTNASYAPFVRYCDYRKLNIKMNTRNIINFDDKKIDFYTTKGDNFGVTIK